MKDISIEIQSPSTEYEFPIQIHSSMEYGLPLYTSSSLSREDSCYSTMSSADISLHSLCSARGSTTSISPRSRHDVSSRRSMENEHEVPLHKIRCLRGLYQCGFYPVLGQKDISIKWSVDAYLDRESTKSRSGYKALPSLRRAKTNQQIQNKPFDRYLKTTHREKTLPNLPLKHDLQKSFTRQESTSTNLSDVDFLLPSSSSQRFGDRWLLRRPTMIQTEPVTEEDTLFKSFTKTIELKPLNFQNTKEQYIFYNEHYPLILQAHGEEEDKVVIQRKRTPTPDPLQDPEARRKINRKTRLSNLETKLNDLETELDDMDFRTELKDDVFYPQRWPWNKYRDIISATTSKTPSPTNRSPSPRSKN